MHADGKMIPDHVVRVLPLLGLEIATDTGYWDEQAKLRTKCNRRSPSTARNEVPVAKIETTASAVGRLVDRNSPHKLGVTEVIGGARNRRFGSEHPALYTASICTMDH